MSAPPKTQLDVTPEEAAAIRDAVRQAELAALSLERARLDHADAVLAFLSDPAVSAPIYDLPRPLTHETVQAWIADAISRNARGEALLGLRIGDDGNVLSYSLFTVWPERSAAEIAGAVRSDLQNHGGGKVGAARSFGWMFDALKVRLLCVTAALDNVRSARVIEAAGFRPLGERISTRPDGATRRSLYWEMSREDWLQRHAHN